MVVIAPFHVEQWMDEYETKAKYNIAETCCASISIKELAEVSDTKPSPDTIIDLLTPQTYGEIRGSTPLRTNLSRLYSSKTGTVLPPENILIQPGAISANYLVFTSLVGPGDHVITHYPTYQALYDVPRSLGAEVSLWKADPAKDWALSIDDLKAMIKPNTKLLVINNPQNPTGAIIPKAQLEEIVAVAQEHNITIMSDEVYRPLFHGITPLDPVFPPSILSMGYANTIATGSLSKAYSLAGIRTGWMASRSPEIIEQCAKSRDYTTISVSTLDQQVAAFALSPDTVHGLLSKNIKLAQTNLAMLEKWIIKHDEFCSWTKPVAGTTAFVKFERDGKPVDSVELCKRLMDKTGVMLVPGDRTFSDSEGYAFKGYVRIGYVNHTETLKDGLEQMRIFMRKEYDDVPLSE